MSVSHKSQYRQKARFQRPHVKEILPEFYQSEYPKLISFLETYYDYTNEDKSATFDDKINNVFGIRDITSTDLKSLDYLLQEIGNGIDHTIFPKEGREERARLAPRLLANLYRSKGTEVSAEQFFRMFFNEEVEVTYPKNNIFYLNDKPGNSLIGPESVKFITDNRRFQIFSILLKTSLSFSDYEDLYKKFIHPAGFYLAADVATKGSSSIDTTGEGTNPLETPYVFIETEAHASCAPEYSLLTMRETDAVDETFILSSEKLLTGYSGMTLERLNDLYGSIAEWGSPRSPRLNQEDIYLSDSFYGKDAEFAEATIDVSLIDRTQNKRIQPDPVPDVITKQDEDRGFNVFFGDTRIETIKLGEENITSIQYSNDQIIVGN